MSRGFKRFLTHTSFLQASSVRRRRFPPYIHLLLLPETLAGASSRSPLCSEWAVNIQRDSYASYVGHYPILAYFALAENESIGRERYNFMQVLSIPLLFCLFMTLRIANFVGDGHCVYQYLSVAVIVYCDRSVLVVKCACQLCD
ncbi:hypothetical protein ACFX1Q_009150 [Malus domestica]